MQVELLSITKTSMGKKELPAQFKELIRPDLVKRAVESIQANKRQAYGASPEAGKRASAELSRRRRKYRGSYGHGISRVPRKILSRSGTRFNWVGAFAPGTVGGRRAHPPKAEKNFGKKINIKERRKAIRSAISSTIIRKLVENRGHKIPKEYPFVVQAKIESLLRTKEVKAALEKLGLKEELKRTSERKIRAGKAKIRGRKYREKKGPLIVVSQRCPLLATASNIPGVEVVEVQNLNAEILAPGADIGRLTIFTEAAVDRLSKEGLFLNSYKGPKKRAGKEETADKETAKEKKKVPEKKKNPEKKNKPARKGREKKEIKTKK